MQDTNPFHTERPFANLETNSAAHGHSSLQLTEYEQIKTLALHQLQYKIINALSLVWNTIRKCQIVFRKPKFSYGFFEWSIEHLLERRKHSLGWLKLLMIRTPLDCLNIRKMEIDLEELVKFIKVMFGDYMRDRSTTAIDKLIRSAVKFIQYEENLTKELQIHSRRYSYTRSRSLAMTFIQVTENETRDAVRAFTFYRALRNRTQERYESAYEEALNDQTEMYFNDKEEKLQRAIDEMKIRIEREMTAGRVTMDMYFTSIQSYRENIERMRIKYDVEYIKWDAEVAYKRKSINNYRARMDFLKAQLQWYKEMVTNPNWKYIMPVNPTLYVSSNNIHSGVKAGERMKRRHTDASLRSTDGEASAKRKSSPAHRKKSDLDKFHFLKGSQSGVSLVAKRRSSRRQSVRLETSSHNKTSTDSSSQQSLKSLKKKTTTTNAKSSKKRNTLKSNN